VIMISLRLSENSFEGVGVIGKLQGLLLLLLFVNIHPWVHKVPRLSLAFTLLACFSCSAIHLLKMAGNRTRNHV